MKMIRRQQLDAQDQPGRKRKWEGGDGCPPPFVDTDGDGIQT